MAALDIEGFIDRSANLEEGDAIRLKRALRDLGYYRPPEEGITGVSDTAMFEAVERFRRDFDLPERGWMFPGGATARRLGELLSGRVPTSILRGPRRERRNAETEVPQDGGDNGCPPHHYKLAQ